MRSVLKNKAKQFLKKYDIGITRYSRLEQLQKESRASNVINLLLAIPDQPQAELLRNAYQSRSQFGQDLFVLFETGFKRNGYFVEFGATNGLELSNSYLLEKEFGWNGIVAEPARRWHPDLKANRNCHIETGCVWRESNSVLMFNEADWGELSGVARDGVEHSGKTYSVQTISLTDLLDKYEAPKNIDYLSIDTEGSEFEILKSFDFDRYRFKIITCEHNDDPQRASILSLLTEKGYVRKFEGVSGCDDWYVTTSHPLD